MTWCSVTVDQDGLWRLEEGPPSLKPLTDEDCVLRRLRQTLFLCLRTYELVHLVDLDLGKWKDRHPDEHDAGELIKDKDNKAIAFRCRLAGSRQVVTARLNDNLSITTILVDEKPDELWNGAYQKTEDSRSALNHMLRRGWYD